MKKNSYSTGRSRRRRRVRGLSLMEITVSLGLMGLVGMGVMSFMKKPMKFVDDATEKLDKSAQADAQGITLVRNLSRSFPMRRGFFRCGSSAMAKLLSLPASMPSVSEGVAANFDAPAAGFSFVTSLGSSLGAIDEDKNLVLPGQSRVTTGSLILLSLMSRPDIGGVYRVTDANPDDSLYAIEAVGQIPGPLGCTVTNSLSIDLLLADPSNMMAGKTTKTFRADVLQVVKYDVRNDTKGGKLLMEQAWPANGNEEDAVSIRETVAFDDYLGISIENGKWTPQSGTTGINGKFSAGLIVKQRAMLGNRSLASKQVVRQLAYTTSDGGNVNTGAVNAPAEKSFKFPTCSLLANPVRGVFHYDNDVYSDMYRVEGRVADVLPASIEIRLTSSGTKLPVCWPESTVTAQPDGRLTFSAAAGMSNVIAIGPSGAGLSTVICDTPPGSKFSGTLVYFHPDLNTVVRQPCSPASIPEDPISYVYDGPPTTCNQSTGQINFGRLVLGEYAPDGAIVLYGENPPEPGPTLYTGSHGCQWSVDSPGTFRDCAPDPARGQLTRIRLQPQGIPFASATDKSEIDCAP